MEVPRSARDEVRITPIGYCFTRDLIFGSCPALHGGPVAPRGTRYASLTSDIVPARDLIFGSCPALHGGPALRAGRGTHRSHRILFPRGARELRLRNQRHFLYTIRLLSRAERETSVSCGFTLDCYCRKSSRAERETSMSCGFTLNCYRR
jgi:hypothetical protein